MPKGTNYSLDEIDSLLDLIEDELPISATLWENIQKSHLSRYPDQRRGVDSIKRKFKELYSKRVKTGDPNCPQEVRRAKRLRHQIVESMNASDLNTVVAGSEEQGSESGDDASSLGEHDNVGSDVVVAHRPRRSSAEVDDEEEEEDDNDLIAEAVDEGAGDLAPTGGAGEDDAAEAIVAEFSPRPLSRASSTTSTSTARQGQRRGHTNSRRRAAVHLTPISRPRNRQRGERDESPEGRPGDQISQMIAVMMMNQGADREERRVEREERREEFRLQLEMQRQQMQAQAQSQQNMMTMMMMTMLGRNASAQNESVASVRQHDDNNLANMTMKITIRMRNIGENN